MLVMPLLIAVVLLAILDVYYPWSCLLAFNALCTLKPQHGSGHPTALDAKVMATYWLAMVRWANFSWGLFTR